jgi:hypothetical protein
MKTVTRRGIARLCALLAGAVATGCLSPTLPPFPPPAEPQTMTYIGPSQLRLSGVLSNKRAAVFAINTETGDIGGKFTRDGNYSFVVSASPGQELELFYEVGRELSGSTFFEAPPYDGTPDAGPSDGGGIDAGANDAGAIDASALDAGVDAATDSP